ncbi:hypothetical protein VIGAN_07204900 [Vigna angularis var. angularis]|uniref:Uncharacterized protein n=1 Tax=Vigna angularis var. angularis TaxID=157739 RepID=A0A0S3SJX8_PHAAN|nr:hypothetical protein VIGAN_07204900 [Vigna angularis var. angularis]
MFGFINPFSFACFLLKALMQTLPLPLLWREEEVRHSLTITNNKALATSQNYLKYFLLFTYLKVLNQLHC